MKLLTNSKRTTRYLIRVSAFAVLIVFQLTLVAPVFALDQFDTDAINFGWSQWEPGGRIQCNKDPEVDVSTLVGSDDAERVFNYLVGKGLPPFQAAGIMGNMQAESGIQPQRLQGTPSGTVTLAEDVPRGQVAKAYGLVQWDPAHKMIDPTKAAGKDPNDLGVQLEFLWEQLTTGSESGAGKLLMATTTVDEAAEVFLRKYERPKYPDATVDFRKSAARQMLAQYGGGSPSGATSLNVSGCPASDTGSGPSGYQNPFRDINNLTPARIDQGVDYNGTGPVYAIGRATVIDVTLNSGWPGDGNGSGGTWISYQLSDGPAKGKFVFFAEDCVGPPGDTGNLPIAVGQNIDSSTIICHMYNGQTAIEIGWAEPGHTQRALAHPYYSCNGMSTMLGQNFSDLLKSLGSTPGVIQTSCPGSPATPASQPLPPGWPTW